MSRYQNAFEALQVVGSRFREDLRHQAESALLARRGKDALRLTGPIGTGKDLVSDFLHDLAGRALGRDGKLIRIPCARYKAKSEHLEAALVGTGSKPGFLDEAAHGTLVFDEVHLLSESSQELLLRLVDQREYRRAGKGKLQRSDAVFVLSSSIDLESLAENGRFLHDLVERAPAKIALLPLWQRREDIGELASHFAEEAAKDCGWNDFEGLSRRAIADLEGALVSRQEASVRRLRDLIRDVVLHQPEAVPLIESSHLAPHLQAHYGLGPDQRDAWDREDLEDRYDLAIEAQTMARLARLHGIPESTLLKLARVLRELHESLPTGENPVPGSYRNLMARMNMATKAALWLLSGATNQSEFRKFFGSRTFEMPPKSVAWQLYHDLFSAGDSH